MDAAPDKATMNSLEVNVLLMNGCRSLVGIPGQARNNEGNRAQYFNRSRACRYTYSEDLSCWNQEEQLQLTLPGS